MSKPDNLTQECRLCYLLWTIARSVKFFSTALVPHVLLLSSPGVLANSTKGYWGTAFYQTRRCVMTRSTWFPPSSPTTSIAIPAHPAPFRKWGQGAEILGSAHSLFFLQNHLKYCISADKMNVECDHHWPRPTGSPFAFGPHFLAHSQLKMVQSRNSQNNPRRLALTNDSGVPTSLALLLWALRVHLSLEM